MKPLVIIMLVALALPAFSQKKGKEKVKDEPPKPVVLKPAPKWDTLFFKNELSLDVSPVIAVLAGAIRQREAFGFTYRRFLDKNDAIRIGTRHAVDQYSNSLSDPGYPGFNGTGTTTFSIFPGDTVARYSMNSTRYYSPDIRVGYEHRFGKRRCKFMLGMDALVGVEMINYSQRDEYHVFRTIADTAGNNYYYVEVTNTDGLLSGNPNDSRTTNLKVGFSPFVGLQIHLTKRFSLNASGMLDVFWGIPISGDKKYTGFNLNTDAVAADIGLTVHF